MVSLARIWLMSPLGELKLNVAESRRSLGACDPRKGVEVSGDEQAATTKRAFSKDTAHFLRLDCPIFLVILHDAQSVNPDVPYAQLDSNCYEVPHDCR